MTSFITQAVQFPAVHSLTNGNGPTVCRHVWPPATVSSAPSERSLVGAVRHLRRDKPFFVTMTTSKVGSRSVGHRSRPTHMQQTVDCLDRQHHVVNPVYHSTSCQQKPVSSWPWPLSPKSLLTKDRVRWIAFHSATNPRNEHR